MKSMLSDNKIFLLSETVVVGTESRYRLFSSVLQKDGLRTQTVLFNICRDDWVITE